METTHTECDVSRRLWTNGSPLKFMDMVDVSHSNMLEKLPNWSRLMIIHRYPSTYMIYICLAKGLHIYILSKKKKKDYIYIYIYILMDEISVLLGP